jgi:hypothetical protein
MVKGGETTFSLETEQESGILISSTNPLHPAASETGPERSIAGKDTQTDRSCDYSVQWACPSRRL